MALEKLKAIVRQNIVEIDRDLFRKGDVQDAKQRLRTIIIYISTKIGRHPGDVIFHIIYIICTRKTANYLKKKRHFASAAPCILSSLCTRNHRGVRQQSHCRGPVRWSFCIIDSTEIFLRR